MQANLEEATMRVCWTRPPRSKLRTFVSKRLARRAAAPAAVWLLLVLAAATSGCSVRKFAINKLGDSLANSGNTFASDNDPEFVGQAIPFSLKLIEGLLAGSPKHRGLLFAAASGAVLLCVCPAVVRGDRE